MTARELGELLVQEGEREIGRLPAASPDCAGGLCTPAEYATQFGRDLDAEQAELSVRIMGAFGAVAADVRACKARDADLRRSERIGYWATAVAVAWIAAVSLAVALGAIG